jgi:hypothetical protein
MSYLGNTPTQQGFIPAIDFFSGNGSTVAFTLSRPVASVAQVQATIENVPQNPGTAFTVSGNTITFDGAPASGTNNIYVYYTSPITQVIQPGQGTVGTAQIANGVTVNFADGSASAPSITNDGDTNTGLFFPTADSIGFAEGGAEVARFDSSGNLGIGTNNPTRRLELGPLGAMRMQTGSITMDCTPTPGAIDGFVWNMSSGYYNWSSGGSTRMLINASGQVTTPFQPAFSAMGLGGVFNSSSWAKLNYSTVITNIGSHYNAANARFTAPVAGSYYLYFNALQRTTTSGARMALYKNGTKFYDSGNANYSQTYNQVNAETMAGAGVIITLAVNDYVEVFGIVAASAGDIYLAGNGHNIFMGYLIG